mmetsp:Transcript_12712/g.36853  ORF Transcript_12712/g.36853 Transcript_12712/m.36853 type:complete len:262 (-) Transcript_12712:573-1358(-)
MKRMLIGLGVAPICAFRDGMVMPVVMGTPLMAMITSSTLTPSDLAFPMARFTTILTPDSLRSMPMDPGPKDASTKVSPGARTGSGIVVTTGILGISSMSSERAEGRGPALEDAVEAVDTRGAIGTAEAAATRGATGTADGLALAPAIGSAMPPIMGKATPPLTAALGGWATSAGDSTTAGASTASGATASGTGVGATAGRGAVSGMKVRSKGRGMVTNRRMVALGSLPGATGSPLMAIRTSLTTTPCVSACALRAITTRYP